MFAFGVWGLQWGLGSVDRRRLLERRLLFQFFRLVFVLVLVLIACVVLAVSQLHFLPTSTCFAPFVHTVTNTRFGGERSEPPAHYCDAHPPKCFFFFFFF